ncbi:DUF397 domain-containing protein [Streptoalloteichus hindustanus]|nr:DUF397 domain-containing protein [Streptoalloteichus hindustanus]
MARWRTSSRTTGGGNCVEVAPVTAEVAVRDSKNRSGPMLLFPRTAFVAFVGKVKSGRLDLG